MKKYTVRHRGSGGAVCETEVEAASREELFEILKARKITAISVAEGGASGRRGTWRRRPLPAKGLAAGIVVVAGALGAFWWLSRSEPARPGEDEARPRPGKTAGTTPAAPEPRAAEPAAVPEQEAAPKPLKPQRVGEIRDGKMLMVDGRLRTMSKHAVTTTVARISIADKTFERSTDQMLAHILEMEPGETMIGDSDLLYKGFDKEFVKSLDTPIIYDKDDDIYVKELKAGVQALRQELKERMEAGEDINALLAETRDQMQELGLYRQELKEQVIQLTQDKDLSQEDYDEIIRAANTMLEERGSKPLDLPVAVKHRLRIWNVKKEGEEQE